MSNEEPQSPEILKEIQAAERKVERQLRSAEQEASAIIKTARVQADRFLSDKRRGLEGKKRVRLDQAKNDAEQEAERIILEARDKARVLKASCLKPIDEAADLILRRILPEWERIADSKACR